MLTKQRYEDYRAEQQTIRYLRADNCIVSDVVRGSYSEPPYTAHSVRVRGVDPARKKANAMIIDQLEQRCAEVEIDIEKAPTSKLRCLLRMKYIDYLTWEEIGSVLEMTPDSCRQAVNRYFKTST